MRVNGKLVEYEPITLLEYLERAGFRDNLAYIIVERNREIITRERFGAVALEPDDEVNVLQFMGGG